MNKAFSKITNVVNAIAVILLLTCYAAPYIDPQNFWPIAFMGLSYKFWVLLNLALMILWIVRRKKRWMYNFIVIAIGFGFISRNIQFNTAEELPKDFSVVSFNTNVQHVYAGGNTSKHIEQYLIDNKIDVALLVEWLNKKGEIDRSEFPHQQFVLLKAKRNSYDYGLKLVSKHKIIDWERIKYGHYSNNMSVYFDIDIDGEIVRFVACHLQGNGIASRDYQRMKKIGFDEESQKYAKNVILRLKTSFEKRSVQTEKIIEVINSSPYPVVVMGDFNDTPQSFAYSKLRGKRKDAFIEKGSGWGATYLKPFPFLRIDYMLYDDKMECTKFETNEELMSDHKMLYGEFAFTK